MALFDKLRKDGTVLTNLKGTRPTTALRKAGDPKPVNDTFSKGQYTNYVLDPKERPRSRDLTDFGA
jgi:hypothetical protein